MRPIPMLAVLLTFAASGCKQELPGDTPVTALSPAPAASPNEIEKRVFPPELIMERQSLLGLTPDQKASIQKDVEQAQAELQPLQWELGAQKEQLAKLLDTAKTDEVQALAVAAKVMAAENKVKAAHLTMLIRIKNALTPEQQKLLRGVPR